jgi:hypothetical protein
MTVKFVPVHTMVPYGIGGVDGSSIHFLTSEVVDLGEWSALHPGRFTTG